MAFSNFKLVRIARSVLIQRSLHSYSSTNHELKFPAKEFKTENKVTYLQDPDTFGKLSIKVSKVEDNDDIKEEHFLQHKPLESQKLTIKQYADIIKQFLKYKRVKEAIDVLEVRMVKQDRVTPENYIYNILIGACADVGYTKKAFKLYNDMKRHALLPTGDTYTCLFEACANSPWSQDGLKNAKLLRELMIQKGIEPNLTNYNAMIKAFGRCGDLSTAFKIIDEMRAKKIKIRVHTFNHLLQACISDKEFGLRHAIMVWRKMLKFREKPNIYSFNLMLKCVKDCNIGNKEDLQQLISSIKNNLLIEKGTQETLQLKSGKGLIAEHLSSNYGSITQANTSNEKINTELDGEKSSNESGPRNIELINDGYIKLEVLDKSTLNSVGSFKEVPNLLSKNIQMEQVLSIKAVYKPQQKFAIVGGLDGFLKEMSTYSVKPDIKTFTQMLPLTENKDAETKLLQVMKSLEIKTDIDFYNMLIKNRCLRMEYDSAFEVLELIKKESEFRKKRYFYNKKLRIKHNIMTYGALALACKSKDNATKLLSDMKEEQLKPNIEILGTLLRHGTFHNDFPYVIQVLNWVKEEKLLVNQKFLEHLEKFNQKCLNLINKNEPGKNMGKGFVWCYQNFSNIYTKWIKEMDIDKALQPEHPWEQFKDPYPETVQRSVVTIQEPKKFYKRSRKYVPYRPYI